MSDRRAGLGVLPEMENTAGRSQVVCSVALVVVESELRVAQAQDSRHRASGVSAGGRRNWNVEVIKCDVRIQWRCCAVQQVSQDRESAMFNVQSMVVGMYEDSEEVGEKSRGSLNRSSSTSSSCSFNFEVAQALFGGTSPQKLILAAQSSRAGPPDTTHQEHEEAANLESTRVRLGVREQRRSKYHRVLLCCTYP